MQRAEPFDRGDLLVLCEGSEVDAGEHGSSVDEDRARAAVALVAALLCPGQPEPIAEDLAEGPVSGSADLDRVSVDVEPQILHGRIVSLPCALGKSAQLAASLQAPLEATEGPVFEVLPEDAREGRELLCRARESGDVVGPAAVSLDDLGALVSKGSELA